MPEGQGATTMRGRRTTPRPIAGIGPGRGGTTEGRTGQGAWVVMQATASANFFASPLLASPE